MSYRFLCAGLAVALLAAHARAADPTAPTTDASPPSESTTDATPAKPSKAQVGLDDIRAFTAVYSLVKQGYVDDVDDHRLMQAAIRGLLVGLDPHSEYLENRQLEQLNEDTTGSYAGIGIEVAPVDGTLRVIAPIDDTPAARGGVKAGDTIVRIDGEPVQSDATDAAIDRLRGKPGSPVTLSILHEGSNAPIEIRLVREAIHVTSAKGRLLEPGYAYLRVSQFQSETGADLRRSVERLRTENGATFKGAVLDLRSNPGGLLTSAVEISDAFLDAGTIVTTRGRIKEADMSFRATPGDLLDGAPLVVLIDNGTASAAEIVAGALKDNHRALLMGRRSFGKGSVQTVLPLDETHAVKLTTARYYTPSGISIQAAGIQPDIELADLTLSLSDRDPYPTISERELRNHLRGDDEASSAPAASSPVLEAPRDYALNEALNALKAMALQRRPVTPARSG